MFSAILNVEDAERASEVVETLLSDGLRGCALTGGLAIEAHLRAHGRPVIKRALNDVDLVVDSFGAIPPALADRFLLNHIHPYAAEGKTLLQLIDVKRALRIDLFRAFGTTLERADIMDAQAGSLRVVAVEDLIARTTAHLCGRLRTAQEVDVKHVRTFTRLAGLGRPTQLAAAWQDHHQDVPGTLQQATQETHELLARYPELLVSEEYSNVVTACARCQDFGPFRLARPQAIIDVLGYW